MLLAQVDVAAEAEGFFDGVKNGLNDAWESMLGFLPNIIGALIILFVGWIVARIIRRVLERVLKRFGLDRLLQRAGMTETLEESGLSASGVVAAIVYWMVLLSVFVLASETLGSVTLSTLLSDLVAYLPLVAVAVVILIIAAAIGNFVSELVAPWGENQNVPWAAAATRWAFLIFGLFAALNTLNVAKDIVNSLFIAVLATAGVGLAVAYGVGGIKTAEKHWSRLFGGSSGPTGI
jgi:MFS family permease